MMHVHTYPTRLQRYLFKPCATCGVMPTKGEEFVAGKGAFWIVHYKCLSQEEQLLCRPRFRKAYPEQKDSQPIIEVGAQISPEPISA